MIISALSVMIIMASLVISTAVITNSMMFEQSVYAVDNCDATSTCLNVDTGIGNTQTNECTNFSICFNGMTSRGIVQRSIQTNECTDLSTCSNAITGSRSNDNIQTNRCDSAPGLGFIDGCTNFATGNDNTQINSCTAVAACDNEALGDDNRQNILCARMFDCGNTIESSSSTQSTTCANGGTCSNTYANSDVLANGASCESHDPDTTTYCQPNRIITRPNS